MRTSRASVKPSLGALRDLINDDDVCIVSTPSSASNAAKGAASAAARESLGSLKKNGSGIIRRRGCMAK